MVRWRAAISRPTVTVVSEGKVPLSMSKEREEELLRALNTILDAVTALNLRDLKAKAVAAVAADQGETSTQGASASSKGKAKVANPDWEDIFHLTQFLSLLCLRGLDSLRSLVLLRSLQ
jgi:hypothetical protein